MSDLCGHLFGGARRAVVLVRVGFGLRGGGAGLHQKKQKVELLQSVSLGLYDEMDKMAKKASADQVTDLALKQVNDFVRDAKDLMTEDSYVRRYKEFVPAGDNPEYRDVVVVMRQLRQGLERLDTNVSSPQARWNERLADAKGVGQLDCDPQVTFSGVP